MAAQTRRVARSRRVLQTTSARDGCWFISIFRDHWTYTDKGASDRKAARAAARAAAAVNIAAQEADAAIADTAGVLASEAPDLAESGSTPSGGDAPIRDLVSSSDDHCSSSPVSLTNSSGEPDGAARTVRTRRTDVVIGEAQRGHTFFPRGCSHPGRIVVAGQQQERVFPGSDGGTPATG